MVTDPVCGMRIDPTRAAARVDRGGMIYYFCSPKCHGSFLENPARYGGTQSPSVPPGDRGLKGSRQPMRAIRAGALALAALLAVYFGMLTLVSGWNFAVDQFSLYWYFIVSLAAGFGVQVGLFLHLRDLVHGAAASGTVVAASGTTSTAAMVSCCTHYLANIAPVIGAAGIVTFATQYQVELFLAGLAFNAAGIGYLGTKVFNAAKEHTRCAHT